MLVKLGLSVRDRNGNIRETSIHLELSEQDTNTSVLLSYFQLYASAVQALSNGIVFAGKAVWYLPGEYDFTKDNAGSIYDRIVLFSLGNGSTAHSLNIPCGWRDLADTAGILPGTRILEQIEYVNTAWGQFAVALGYKLIDDRGSEYIPQFSVGSFTQ